MRKGDMSGLIGNFGLRKSQIRETDLIKFYIFRNECAARGNMVTNETFVSWA